MTLTHASSNTTPNNVPGSEARNIRLPVRPIRLGLSARENRTPVSAPLFESTRSRPIAVATAAELCFGLRPEQHPAAPGQSQ